MIAEKWAAILTDNWVFRTVIEIVHAKAVVKRTEAAVPKSCTEEVLVSEKAGVPVKNLRKQKYSNAKVLRLLSDPSENI